MQSQVKGKEYKRRRKNLGEKKKLKDCKAGRLEKIPKNGISHEVNFIFKGGL